MEALPVVAIFRIAPESVPFRETVADPVTVKFRIDVAEAPKEMFAVGAFGNVSTSFPTLEKVIDPAIATGYWIAHPVLDAVRFELADAEIGNVSMGFAVPENDNAPDPVVAILRTTVAVPAMEMITDAVEGIERIAPDVVATRPIEADPDVGLTEMVPAVPLNEITPEAVTANFRRSVAVAASEIEADAVTG